MASATNKKNSDGYKRNKLLSAMDKPGENITMLSKELKKLAAFMRNKNAEETTEEKQITEEQEIKTNNSFSTIDTFLEESGVEETSLDDILKTEGYKSDYFSAEDEIEELTTNNQISSINSFLDAVENGEFKNISDECIEEDEEIDNLEEEEYNKPLEEEFLTESLAHIYIKQRKYHRALEIIKCISLKNPEKNIYFADQIRFLEKLIINVKTE